MNLKNKPTVIMPTERMYACEREWGMSKAAWMDVAFDMMQQLIGSTDAATVMSALKERADLILMYRERWNTTAQSDGKTP